MNRNHFGDHSHYYSSPDVPIPREEDLLESPAAQAFKRLLLNRDSHLQQRVEQSCKRFNLMIRDYLRSETALKLAHEGSRQNVPVQVVAGMPLSLEKII